LILKNADTDTGGLALVCSLVLLKWDYIILQNFNEKILSQVFTVFIYIIIRDKIWGVL